MLVASGDRAPLEHSLDNGMLMKINFFPKEESKTKIMKPLSCSIFKQTYRTAFLVVPLPVFSIGLGG